MSEGSIADLGYRVNYSEVEGSVGSLDKMVQATDRAERATDSLGISSRETGSAIHQMLASIAASTAQLVELTRQQMGLASASTSATGALNNEVAAINSTAQASGRASSSLQQMAQAVNAAEAASRKAAPAATKLGTEVQRASHSFDTFYDAANRDFATQYGRQMNVVASTTEKVAKSNKIATLAGLNMSRQFADIGVTAAMGMNPLMIMIQQGPQIADSLQMASTAGLGFKDVMKGMWVTISPLLTALIPFVAAAAAAGAAFALFNREVSKGYPKDITDGLGLTAEQLKRVEDRTIGMGDTFKATIQVIGDMIMDGPIGTALNWLGDTFGMVFDTITSGAMANIARIIGFFGAAFETIRDHWKQFPQVMGAIMVGYVNVTLRAIEGLINASIAGINRVTSLVGWKPISPVALGEIKQANNAVAADFEASYKRINAAVLEGGSDFVDAVRARAIKNAQDKAREDAGDPNKGAKGSTKKEKEELDDLTRAMIAFNKAAEERNKIAEQFEKFKVKTISDPIAIAGAAVIGSGANELNRYADALDQVAAHTESAAQGMAKAFGSVGAAVGDVISKLANFDAKQSDITARQADAIARLADVRAKEGVTIGELQEAQRDFDAQSIMLGRESAKARVKYYGDMAGAAKGFFKEGSLGYKALQGAEMAYRVLEMAMAVKSMVTKVGLRGAETAAAMAAYTIESGGAVAAETVKTGATTAGAAVRIPLKIAEGVASMFATLGPFGFAAVGAMLAVMASVGFGGRSGGAAPGSTDMTDRQAAQGAGSVLGDPTAKSASLEKAMGHAEAYQNSDLEYSSAMVRSLRSIDGNMDALASAVARSLGAGGVLDTDKLNIGTSGRPATLSNLGFGNTTTRSLQDQGLSFATQTVGEILTNGVQGQAFQQVLSTTIKKAFGITYSNKSTSTTTTTDLDADMANQIKLVVESLKMGVATAAGLLGVTGAEATINAMQLAIGKISLEGMSGSEIRDALNGVFGKVGDDMANEVVPGLAAVQKVGEGLFETLVRVARQYQVVDVTLASVGMTFGAVGLASLEARERLVELSGGLDAFTEGTSAFAENFLTEAERLAPVQKAVTAELSRLGLAADITREQFKSVVLGLDLTSEAGAEMYAAMIAVAPAFAKVLDFTDALAASAKEIEDSKAAEATEKAAAIQATQIDLMRQLQLMDDAALGTNFVLLEDRKKELAKLDETSQGLKKIIWAREDEAKIVEANAKALEAANAKAAELLAKRTSLEDQLLVAMGRTAEATARQRTAVIAGLDPSLRELQSAYDAVTDATARVAAAEAARSEAESVLTEAYDRERSALLAVRDEARGVSESLRHWSRALDFAEEGGSSAAARQTMIMAELERLVRQVKSGDMKAAGEITNMGDAALVVAKDTARTQVDYAREVARVRRLTEEAALIADDQVDVAEAQLAALDASVVGLLTVNSSVLSVRDAIAGMSAALSELARANASKSQADAAAQAALAASQTAKNRAGVTIGVNDNADVAAAKALYLSTQGGIDSATFDRYVGANPFATMKRLGYEGDPEALRAKYKFAGGGSFDVPGPSSGDNVPVGIWANGGENVSVSRKDSMEAVAEALKRQNALLERQNALLEENLAEAKITSNATNNIDLREERRDFEGLHVRGDMPGVPVSTKEAA